MALKVKINIYNLLKISTQKQKIEDVNNIKDFYFSSGDMVGEKMGKINKDYTLMNPPLGKGINKIHIIFIYFSNYKK